jgi:phosphoenolpyruvate-protein phosphotransferase (PTS system enzyme I)
MADFAPGGEKIYRGIPVSAGVCHGKILVLGTPDYCIASRRLEEHEVPQELQRLEQALFETRHQILEVQRKVSEGLGAKDASIFDAHLLVLEDPTLIDEVTRLITEERMSADQAFHHFAQKYADTLSRIDDDYLRERVSDLRDVSARVLNNLLGCNDAIDLRKLRDPAIIIGYDLAPSITAQLDRKKVLGFATDIGSKTSHTAIMARSLQIPAIVGLQVASKQLKTGDYALLDGFNGLIILNPTDQTLFEYGQLVRRKVTLQERLQDVKEKPAVTLDGVRITLSANVEHPEDAETVQAYGAEGVGLFRTEYLFINRQTLPSEEEQYLAYRRIAQTLKPDPVVIRTLDLGGDKFISHLEVPKEMNPFLGWRAIRFCLQEREIFRAQLRAILRASAEGNIKLMYPMVSCVEELHKANALVEEYKEELRSENLLFDEKLEIGVMIEIPSAALAADAFAKKVKFLSVGTNDLIQYALAVDRLNERIAHLYEPTHPAIIRLIKMTADAAQRNGIWAGVCGEMAGDPVLTPLLLGLGIRELSTAPSVVPQIKYLIRRLKMEEATELAEFALTCESGAEVLARSQALARKIAPLLFENQLPPQA